MNCIYNKVRTKKYKKYIYCTKQRKIIQYSNCKGCPYKEYKVKEQKQMKQRTSKQTKLERDRFSLFTDDLEYCIICGKSLINKHEIFGGRNRLNSIKYGLVIPLCTCEHHNQVECKGIHFDKKLRNEWHKKG